ncbi:PEP-CTERM sorting domain-containing protein [Nostoc sp. CHAB 5784]|uniref:PEP-CTERM sorting domain-containing protein n=1 Tax=Nostoc mirabile TaxID=2907820 RepID=UPI001E5C92A7|nr:PEP-CTERM sorting domain-containing protein [Nostoc mirabile]MCC5665704.1 PEP-CTERM sorting domain-containing protein [Nostoc mirabile CHAB5784]
MKIGKTTLCMGVGLGLSFALSAPAIAVGIGGGITSGPDDSFYIDFTLFDEVLSTSDVVSITLNGSTASTFPLVWEDVVNEIPPPGASVSISGQNTQLLAFNFTPTSDGFNPGESFSFSVDPDTVDDPDAGITIQQLIGTQVNFNFADSSSFLGVFVDNPAPNAGLVLRPRTVPESASSLSMVFGALGVGLVLKRKQKAIAKV